MESLRSSTNEPTNICFVQGDASAGGLFQPPSRSRTLADYCAAVALPQGDKEAACKSTDCLRVAFPAIRASAISRAVIGVPARRSTSGLSAIQIILISPFLIRMHPKIRRDLALRTEAALVGLA
jgi:hypothetical protein